MGFPSCTGLPQESTTHSSFLDVCSGQYRSRDEERGILQLCLAQHGWPRVIPSMTTTKTDFSTKMRTDEHFGEKLSDHLSTTLSRLGSIGIVQPHALVATVLSISGWP